MFCPVTECVCRPVQSPVCVQCLLGPGCSQPDRERSTRLLACADASLFLHASHSNPYPPPSSGSASIASVAQAGDGAPVDFDASAAAGTALTFAPPNAAWLRRATSETGASGGGAGGPGGLGDGAAGEKKKKKKKKAKKLEAGARGEWHSLLAGGLLVLLCCGDRRGAFGSRTCHAHQHAACLGYPYVY